MDSMVTLRACAGLNGMRLGNSILTVVQATPDVNAEVNPSPYILIFVRAAYSLIDLVLIQSLIYRNVEIHSLKSEVYCSELS